MAKLVCITDADIVTGEKFVCCMECCEATVLSTFTSLDGTNYVACEKGDGSVRRYSFEEFKAEYSKQAKHELVNGDIFVINDGYGKNRSGMVFLYVDDSIVLRFSASKQPTEMFTTDTSYTDLAYYVRQLAGGDYSQIKQINNTINMGVKVTRS